MEGAKAWVIVSFVGFAVLPGCHVLVRLGEPGQEEQAAEQGPTENQSPSVDDPDSTGPPAPAFDRDEPKIMRLPSLDAQRPPARQITRRKAGVGRLRTSTGINTNTAIAPGEGQTVYRTQLRFQEFHSSPGAAKVDANLLVNPHVLAYGVREDFTLFGVLPFVLREGTARPPGGGFAKLDSQGSADLRFFGKYRFYEKDLPGETYRWSILGGLEVPTYDEPFTSDSWDPFLGTVWTYQSLEWGLDLDAVWQFNTGERIFRHDLLTYNAAYTYVLLTGQTLDEEFWQLNGVFEFNGSYLADGSHLLFASPGFQLALERMIVEASLQLPVIRDLKIGLEPDFLFAIGTRITW